MIRPRGNLVLLEVDPEDRRLGKAKILVAADEQYLTFCKWCDVKLEALTDTPGCAVIEEFTLDPIRDTYRITDRQRRHEIVREKFPIVVEPTRVATVLALGVRASRDLRIGDRVLIDAEAGVQAPGTTYRLVPSEAILAQVTE
jgi:hypothetical protein